jgi:osmoprotectant transport system ATP-binding protein
VIRFEEVTKVYPGGVRAVDGVSFTIAEGECVVFVGPSGCGKTTTLKLANQLLAPTSGRILVGGQDIATQDPITLRRGIGYVIQDVGLLPHMTIIQNVGLVPRLLGWRRSRIVERARELLDLVGLPPAEFAEKHPHQLSGGQRQRVGVARALAADPPVILMDEPFGALDPVTRAQLQDEFLRLRTRVRKTILFITHDIDEAVRLGERIAVMRAGKIVQLGSPRDVLRRPADDFVGRFVGHDRAMKLLKLARVRDLVDRRVAKVAAEATVDEARRVLEKSGGEVLVIVGADGVFQGILRFQDLAGRVGPVGRFPLRPHPTALEEQSLHEAMAQMVSAGTAWLPVVDAGGRLLGIVTMSGFTRVMAAERSA